MPAFALPPFVITRSWASSRHPTVRAISGATAGDALNRLLLVRFASDMGFTLGEIRIFLSGLRSDVPVGPRWRKLAHRKIKQVDASIKRSRQLKSLLEHLLQCRCPSLPVCVRRLSLSPTLQKLQGSPRSHAARLSR